MIILKKIKTESDKQSISVLEPGTNGDNRYEMVFSNGKFKGVRVYHNDEYVGGLLKERENLTRVEQLTDRHNLNGNYPLNRGDVLFLLGQKIFDIRMMNAGETRYAYARHSYLMIDEAKRLFVVGNRKGGRACFSYSKGDLKRVSLGSVDLKTPVALIDSDGPARPMSATLQRTDIQPQPKIIFAGSRGI